MSAGAFDPSQPREIAPLVDRLKAVVAAPPGHHVFSTTVDADLLREAIDELERLRVAVDRLVRGMAHPDRCPASYGPMHRCDCGVQKLIDSVLP